jgi:hypothetical protein
MEQLKATYTHAQAAKEAEVNRLYGLLRSQAPATSSPPSVLDRLADVEAENAELKQSNAVWLFLLVLLFHF